jgi:large subunit ribosomal protein L6
MSIEKDSAAKAAKPAKGPVTKVARPSKPEVRAPVHKEAAPKALPNSETGLARAGNKRPRQVPEGPSVTVPLPAGVKVKAVGKVLTAEGPRGKSQRRFPLSAIALSSKDGEARLVLTLPERRETHALLLSWERHVANMAAGVTVGFEAKAKVVAAHFPMKVYSKDNWVIIENFLGEKHPRKSPLVGSTKVEVKGDELVFTGNDIEEVGQSVANLERATHIRNYDPRVFQDGIYVTTKAHPREGA